MEIKKHFNTFSEAIREGAKLRPQGRGMFFRAGRTCAYGAGTEAVTGEANKWEVVWELYPYLCATDVTCPKCEVRGAIQGIIYHLNDDHGWKRERIADWLESEEEKLGYVLLTEEPQSCNIKDSERTKESFIAA